MSTSDVQTAIRALEPLKDDQLYAELGKRLQLIGQDPKRSAEFGLTVPKEAAEAFGTIDDLRAFGREFFNRVNHQAYGLVCGSDSQNTEDRKKIEKAASLSKDAFTTTLATLLIAQLGLAPALVPVIALLIARLAFDPAIGAMCAVWKTKLGPAAA
jgi:hypothetical protein